MSYMYLPTTGTCLRSHPSLKCYTHPNIFVEQQNASHLLLSLCTSVHILFHCLSVQHTIPFTWPYIYISLYKPLNWPYSLYILTSLPYMCCLGITGIVVEGSVSASGSPRTGEGSVAVADRHRRNRADRMDLGFGNSTLSFSLGGVYSINSITQWFRFKEMQRICLSFPTMEATVCLLIVPSRCDVRHRIGSVARLRLPERCAGRPDGRPHGRRHGLGQGAEGRSEMGIWLDDGSSAGLPGLGQGRVGRAIFKNHQGYLENLWQGMVVEMSWTCGRSVWRWWPGRDLDETQTRRVAGFKRSRVPADRSEALIGGNFGTLKPGAKMGGFVTTRVYQRPRLGGFRWWY